MLQTTNHLKTVLLKFCAVILMSHSINKLLIIILLIGHKKSEAGNSNVSGTGSVSVSAQGSS